MRTIHVAVFSGLLLGLIGSAHADTLAINFTNTTGQTLANPPFTLGWSFTTNSNIDVTNLGLFDDSQDGLVDAHDVGLWDSSGNLLVSTTIPNGTLAPLDDKFRMEAVAPTLLLSGNTYYIGAIYDTGDDPLIFPGNATGFTTAPEINFVENNFVFGPTLAFPSNTVDNEPAYFGPNFEYTPASSVPEPSFAFLTAALGLALVGARKYFAGAK